MTEEFQRMGCFCVLLVMTEIKMIVLGRFHDEIKNNLVLFF